MPQQTVDINKVTIMVSPNFSGPSFLLYNSRSQLPANPLVCTWGSPGGVPSVLMDQWLPLFH